MRELPSEMVASLLDNTSKYFDIKICEVTILYVGFHSRSSAGDEVAQ
jgi:hypothetical protein